MADKVQVKDHRDLVRDSGSKAILNTNIEALQAYKKKKATFKKIEKIDTLEDKIHSIEKKIDHVLEAMNKLVK